MDNLVANTEKLGEWVRGNRKAKGLTLEELASRAGMSKQYLSIIERAVGQPGTGNPIVPSREIITSICNALNVSPAEPFRLAGHAVGGDQEFDLPNGVVVQFQQGSKLSGDDRTRIIDTVSLMIRGIANEELERVLRQALPPQPPDQT